MRHRRYLFLPVAIFCTESIAGMLGSALVPKDWEVLGTSKGVILMLLRYWRSM